MKLKTKLNYFYDQEADILYVSKGSPSQKDISNEINEGVIARIDPKTHKIRGFTILNFAARSKRASETVPLPFNISFN